MLDEVEDAALDARDDEVRVAIPVEVAGNARSVPVLGQGGDLLLDRDLLEGTVGASSIAGAALAVLGPLLLLGFAIQLASRHFVAGISGDLTFEITRDRGWSAGPFVRLGRLLVREREERAGYEYCLALSRRDPQFLRTSLPQLIGMQVMGLAMVLNLSDIGDVGPQEARWALSIGLPTALGFLLMAVPSLLEMSQFSKDAEARWAFQVAPIENAGAILSGALKALTLGLVAPVAVFELAVIPILLGAEQFGPTLLALQLTSAIAFAMVRRMQLTLPFTRVRRGTGRQGFANCGVMFVMMMLLGAMVVVHLLLTWNVFVMWVAIAALVPVVAHLWRDLRHTWPASGVLAD